MKNFLRIAAGAFLVLGFLILGGGYSSVAAEKGVLRLGVGVDATTLDPHNYKAGGDLLVDHLIYENLVMFDVKLNLRPVLAESWENIDDVTWRFKIRKGVKFHDGTGFDAQVAKYNLDRVRSTSRGNPYYGMIASVTVEDDYTILVKTKEPNSTFLTNLSEPVGAMVSPKAVEKYGQDYGQHPVGSGPFRFKEWRPKEKLILVRNDDYWGEKAKLDQFVMIPIPEEGTRAMAFESGEIDVIADPLPHRIAKYKADANIQVLTTPSTRTVWVGFNAGDKVLENVTLRQAIGHAINKDEIVKYVVEGLAQNARAVVPPIIMEPQKEFIFNYDPKKAGQLLKEAGYPQGLEVTLWSPEGRYLKDRQIAEAVQAQLAQIGVKANLRVLEWGSYLDAMFRHEQQLFIIGWGFNAGSPDSALRSCFYSDSQFNFSNYKNTEIDKLLDTAVATMDDKKRYALYENIQQILIDQAVLVPIYHKLEFYAASKNVKDFYPHPMELIEISKTTVE